VRQILIKNRLKILPQERKHFRARRRTARAGTGKSGSAAAYSHRTFFVQKVLAYADRFFNPR
jgi:hypothetical protein